MSLVRLARTEDLGFCSEHGSRSDATCEKGYKSLACCIKQTQKLTTSDSRWGIMQNWMKTRTEYPVELPFFPVSHTHSSAKMHIIFHYTRGKCHHRWTGASLGWERVENTVGAAWHPSSALLWGDSVGSSEELTQPINSSFRQCMSRNHRTDV